MAVHQGWHLICLVLWIYPSSRSDAQRVPVQCSIPELPSFGTYNYTTGKNAFPGTIVTYDCEMDYELQGSEHRKCMPNGSWAPEMPTCVKKNGSCPYPGRGNHMKLSEEKFFYSPNSTIRYSCDLGYIVIGPLQRQCLHNGTWSDFDPVCASILSMQKNIVGYSSYVDVNEVSDQRGMKILDNSNFQCSVANMERRQKAYWKIDLLEELEVDVIVLIFGNYQDIKATLFWGRNITDRIEITKSDYMLSTLPLRNGQQESTTLEYKLVKPMKMRFLRIDVDPIPASRLNFCEAMILSKKEPSSGGCYSDKIDQWRDTTALMLRKQCYSVPHTMTASFNTAQQKCQGLRNGSLANDIDVDTQQFLSLSLFGFHRALPDKNYWIGGHQGKDSKGRIRWLWTNKHEITDFSWSAGQPNEKGEDNCIALSGRTKWLWDDKKCDNEFSFVCQHALRKCGLPDSNELCKLSEEATETNIDTTVSYECPAGYQLVGNRTRRCLQDGTWTGSAPHCEKETNTGTRKKQGDDRNPKSKFQSGERVPAQCSIPELPKFGTYNYTIGKIIFPGTIVVYDCETGYKLQGPKHRKCMLDGSWMPEMPECVRKNVSCPYPGLGKHMSVDEVEFFYSTESVIRYGCEIGYTIVGPKYRHCLPNGNWSDDDPVCASIVSIHKNIVAHSTYVDINEVSDQRGMRILDNSNFQCSVADMANRQKSYWKIDLLEEQEVDVITLIFGNYQEITATLFWGRNLTENIEITTDKYNLLTDAQRNGQQESMTLEFMLLKPMKLRFLLIEVEPIPSSRLYFCEALILSKKEPSFSGCYSDRVDQLKDTTTTMLRKQCYSFPHSTNASFITAQTTCEELRNGSLANDVDLDIQQLLSLSLVGVNRGQTDKNYWIGGSQGADSKGRLLWLWTNKHQIKDFFWSTGEPNDNTGASCIALSGRTKWFWDDKKCDNRFSFVCQHALQKCGLPDSKELCKLSDEMTNTNIDTTASYECPTGYDLKGSRTRKCMQDGTWSGSAPHCEKKPEIGDQEKQKKSKSGLPAGAIAAVVIGIILALIIILLVIFFVMYKKKSGSAEIKYSKKSESAEVLDVDDKKGTGGRQNYAATDDSNK